MAVVQFGPSAGKTAAIVDVIDQNRALIDGPVTGVKRQAIQFKRLRLTQFRIRIPNGTSSKTVADAWKKNEITKKWLETKQAKRLEANRLVCTPRPTCLSVTALSSMMNPSSIGIAV